MFSKNEIPNKAPRIVYDLVSRFTIIISFITFEYCYFISLPMNHFSAAAKKIVSDFFNKGMFMYFDIFMAWSLLLIDYS